jgi:ribosome-associated toxin RatA of RatAB toxin-antitoxin module
MKRFGLFLAAALLAAPLAEAQTAPAGQTSAQRNKAVRYTVKKPGSKVEAGAARIVIEAPLADAQSTVTNFAKYSRMISKFEESKVVAKNGNQTDVYLRVPLKIKIPLIRDLAKMWAVLRFGPPKQVNKDEVEITSSMVDGNLERFETKYRLRKLDEKRTQLEVEMYLVPKLPAPASYVTSEVTDAAQQAARKFRDCAEKTIQCS